MKRLSLGIFIAIFCLAGLAISATAQELLSNEGFETWTAGPDGPPDNWFLSDDDTTISATQESTIKRTGSYSCELYWTTSYTRWMGQSVAIPVAESCYTFSCYAYDNDPLGRVRAGITFLAADDSTIVDAYQPNVYTTDGTSWQFLTTGSRKAPAGAAYVRGEVRVYDVGWDSTTTGATAYVDDASLQRTTCPPPSETVSIYEIQFNNTIPGGTAPDTCYPSPLMGTSKVFGGIVTHMGVAQGYPDFWLQNGSEPWCGVFVYQPTYEPEPGDSVIITAEIIEYYGMTEIQGLTTYEVVSSGNPVPDPVNITPGDLAETYQAGCDPDAEAYEGVLCKLTNVICVALDTLNQFYVADFAYSDTCQIDDLIYTIPTPAVGDTFLSITGIVQYSYGEYELNPRGISDVVWENPPVPAGPAITGISWTPTLPQGNSVSVMASIFDTAATTQNDSLFYQLNDTTGTWSAVASDSISDNYHYFTIPGQTVEDTVYFYAYAENDTGGISASPIKKYTTTEDDQNVRINEFFYDAVGADAGCFIELYGPPSLSLTGYSVVMVNGFDGTDKKTIDLTGYSIPTDGFFVIAQDTDVPEYDIVDANADFENGPDNIHLRRGGFTVDAVGYGTFDQAEYFMGETWPTFDPGFPYGFSLGRYPDGADADYNRRDFGVYGSAYRTPGDTNLVATEYSIYNIQYVSKSDSPHKTERVTVGGIVTADPVECTYNPGYYIEMSSGGPWSGVLVYDLFYEPSRGDSVQVKGTVTEEYGRTQISYVTEYANYGAGTLPDPYPTSTGNVYSDESLEGVLVQVQEVTVVDTLGYGEFMITDGDVADTCLADDICGYSTTVVPGDEFAVIRGVVDYSFGKFRIQPRDDDDFMEFAPAGLTITKSGSDLQLQWNEIKNALYYIIYRSSDPTDPGDSIAYSTGPETLYVDGYTVSDDYYTVEALYEDSGKTVYHSSSRKVGAFDKPVTNVK